MKKEPHVAVLIPCLNEEVAIQQVIADFRAALPKAEVYVYDNGSTDLTVERARAAGAIVRSEPVRGKGNVVRRMFSDVDADVYVLVDGDCTYDAPSAPRLIAALLAGPCDMVTGARLADTKQAYRPGHRLGNATLTRAVQLAFGVTATDILSGYRVFSRRFVKTFPASARGFEIETELSVHALEMRMPATEVATPYQARPKGSHSKLSTFGDGFRILRTIGWLLCEERPLATFSAIAAFLAALAIVLIVPVVETYVQTGLVPRQPTAILSTGLMLLGFLSFACGLILNAVTRARRHLSWLSYLAQPAPTFESRDDAKALPA